jgi:hypothetical protein
MDIPQIETPVEASEPPAKRSKSTTVVRGHFCERIRSAAGWFTTMEAGTWKNVTSDKMKRTLFVLQTPAGGEQFCCVGKVFNARLSQEELRQPLPYDTSDEHTELSIALSMRPMAENKFWTNYEHDITAAATAFCDVRQKAIDDAFVPLLHSKPDKMPGMPDSKLKKGFGKTKKDIADALNVMWGGTGMNAEGDIVRFRRKCYGTTVDDLSSGDKHTEWLNVADERGDAINYINEHKSIRTGDTVLVWYRVLAQACAGNFHLSLEPRQIMRLGRGDDATSKGSAGLAASMAAAMERGDEV